MSYYAEQELFIVIFNFTRSDLIMSKTEIQHLLKTDMDRKRIKRIKKIMVNSWEEVNFSYFKPKKLPKDDFNKKLWDKICKEEPCNIYFMQELD